MVSDFYIIRDIFPTIVYRFMFLVKCSIITESSLSFLGIGNSMLKSLGSILYYAQNRNMFLTSAWLWWIVPAGLCILSISFVLIAYIVKNTLVPKGEVTG